MCISPALAVAQFTGIAWVMVELAVGLEEVELVLVVELALVLELATVELESGSVELFRMSPMRVSANPTEIDWA